MEQAVCFLLAWQKPESQLGRLSIDWENASIRLTGRQDSGIKW